MQQITYTLLNLNISVHTNGLKVVIFDKVANKIDSTEEMKIKK